MRINSVLSLVAALVLSTNAQNLTWSDGNVLHVTGTGREDVASSVTSVHLAVQKTGGRADSAQNATATAVEDIVRALEGADVRDLKTESVIVQPVYNYTEVPPTILSYEGISTLSYRVRNNHVGKTLDAALQAGANRVDSVVNEIERSRADAAYLRALEDAARDAERKARRVANELAVCITSPTAIMISPPLGSDESFNQNSAAAVNVPGQTTVTAQVHLAYAYKPGHCAAASSTTAAGEAAATATED